MSHVFVFFFFFPFSLRKTQTPVVEVHFILMTADLPIMLWNAQNVSGAPSHLSHLLLLLPRITQMHTQMDKNTHTHPEGEMFKVN